MCDQTSAGRDVEERHPGPQASSLQGLAAIPGARAQIQHLADAVVVGRRAVEQLADE